MKKASRFIVLLLLVLAIPCPTAHAIIAFPEWLSGTFCINLQCSDAFDSARTHCVYCIDFDSKTETIFYIDTDALLMKDLRHDGNPLIISKQKSGYDIETGRNRSVWRGYEISSIISSGSDNSNALNCGSLSIDNIGGTIDFDAPITVLGIDYEQERVYMLQYGISEVGDMEICMAIHKNFFGQSQETILHSFPIDYNFGSWKCAISECGKIAWFDPEEKALNITSDDGEIILDNRFEAFSGETCWLDEENLLFFEGSTSSEGNELPLITYKLMEWSLENGVQEVHTKNGSPLEFEVSNVISPYKISLNSDKRLISCYYADMADGSHKLKFFSIEDGQSYEVSLWPYASYDEDGDFISRYGLTQDGLILYQPNGEFEVNCVWF